MASNVTAREDFFAPLYTSSPTKWTILGPIFETPFRPISFQKN
jgi:hypothetical protein